MNDRERVARIIDPKAWEALDWYMAEQCRPPSFDTTMNSLVMADTILAALAARPVTPDSEELVRIGKWIDEAIERAKRHGGTEGVWLFGSQWRVVRAALAADPAPNVEPVAPAFAMDQAEAWFWNPGPPTRLELMLGGFLVVVILVFVWFEAWS